MLNEIQEFSNYTGEVECRAESKYDSAYLGRFTYDMLLKFEGLSRVLTILARGYLWQGEQPQPDRAYRASLIGLCGLSEFVGSFIGKDLDPELFQVALTRCCAVAVADVYKRQCHCILDKGEATFMLSIELGMGHQLTFI